MVVHHDDPVAASPDVVLDASTLALRCEISVDGTLLSPSTLVNSVSARYILDWLQLHRKSLAVDRVEGPRSDADDLICAGTQDRLTELHLDLALRTSEASGGSRKAINGQPGGQSEDDQSQTPADAGMNVLVSLLSAPSAGTSALHFTLAPLLHAALSKLCKKLVSAFPLCFNARWLTRLYNDRSSYVFIGNSLGSILDLHSSDRSRDESPPTATIGDPRVAREADLLYLSLQMRYETGRRERDGESQNLTTDRNSPSFTEVIDAALLRVGKTAGAPDLWLGAAAEGEAANAIAGHENS
ncbi:hypothetical protein B0A53_03633 [Rhodotorula sp. CCFEE 5036]|nr:hypothetical protein B0A53_03633 [Rhodotorula sp. CCFEE 5036]